MVPDAENYSKMASLVVSIAGKVLRMPTIFSRPLSTSVLLGDSLKAQSADVSLASANEKPALAETAPVTYNGPVHIAHIHASMNNTIITITNLKGDALNWASSGTCGFKGARRSSAYAAQEAGLKVGKAAREQGVQVIRVQMKGLGQGRANAIKGLQSGGLAVMSVSDVTPVPHNGARPKKARRL